LKIENIGNTIKRTQIPQLGMIMGELVYALKNIKRTDFPIFLDPKTASFIQVAQHGKIRQYLSDSTIIKNIRYARFMELHHCPVNFRNLTPEMVLQHFDYRIQYESATGHALNHEKKAIMMFLRAYGLKQEEMELWSQVLKTPPVVINDKIEFVYPQNVHKFFSYEGYSNQHNYETRVYENKLFQHIAFMGFNFGMRCPSEILSLTLDDIVINHDGTGHITIHEQKKRGKTRDIIPYSRKILSSDKYKSPKNYRDHWRPKVANDNSGKAFFLQPSGKPITEKYVRDHLSSSGKKITGDPHFTPYHMRHTFATFLYQYTKNIKKVSKKLGHTKTANTDKYVEIAEDLEEQFDGKNLFNIALKPHNTIMGGQQNKQVTLVYPLKKASNESNFSKKKIMGQAGFEPAAFAV
jgi:site-specific recombinase XerD